MEATEEDTDQRAVIDFLSRPASYSLGVETVERVETHCSIVFLAGRFAYKLKRAILYADLDDTTRERRRKACEAELVLNRRTAPDLYLTVRAIRRTASGALAFGGAGTTLDHVVVMRRFAEENLFDRLAERSALTPEQMIALGASVARLHRMAEIEPAHGDAAAIRRVIEGNRHELGRHAPSFDGAALAAWEARVRAERAWREPLLELRRAAGKVRRCHGDLRLANIVLDAGRPLLFDCVEFSDEIGCIDVLYDLAFLLMDLLLRDRPDLANRVFNAYLDREPETDGLAVLPLFLSLRAATRSYALAGSAERKKTPREAARTLASARRHLAAAIAFLDPEPPRLIALGGEGEGVCGEARASLAASLAGFISPPPGARLVHVGPSAVSARQAATAGRAATAWQEAGTALTAGCSVLAEGAFLSPAERSRAAALAERLGVTFVGLWFGAPRAGVASPPWRVLETGQGVLAALAGVAVSDATQVLGCG